MDVAAERARLAGRLEHRLQSSVLLIREAAERGDLEGVSAFALELGRRARGLARSCAPRTEAASALRDALAEWMGGDASWRETADGYVVEAAPGHEPPEVIELGEPLARLLAVEAGGRLVFWSATAAEVGGVRLGGPGSGLGLALA